MSAYWFSVVMGTLCGLIMAFGLNATPVETLAVSFGSAFLIRGLVEAV